MPIPRPRFSVRGLMVVVAIVAMAIAGGRLWRHCSKCLERARYYGSHEEFYASLSLEIAGDLSRADSETADALLPDGRGVQFRSVNGDRRVFYPPDTAEPADAETVEKLVRLCREASNRFGELRRKYERAARSPWLSVEPDRISPEPRIPPTFPPPPTPFLQ